MIDGKKTQKNKQVVKTKQKNTKTHRSDNNQRKENVPCTNYFIYLSNSCTHLPKKNILRDLSPDIV